MFQSFADTASPDQGPPRLNLLRAAMAKQGLAGYMVPRADAHQGEYVSPRDDRLAWLTGFTGSAGFCIALMDSAGVFVDGRYRVQVKVQVDTTHFTPVNWPEIKPAEWLREALPQGGKIGFDSWLYTPEQIETLEVALVASGISLHPVDNLIDKIWPDQPAAPRGQINPYPVELAGKTHTEKRTEIGQALKRKRHESAVITLPDSIAWLLNIRGSDIPRNPVPHAFAIVHDTGHLTLFADPEKIDDTLRAHLGPDIKIRPPNAFAPGLHSLTGPVQLDKSSVPLWVLHQLAEAGVAHIWEQDPCILPKARKSQAEISATRNAHLRDGAALCEFLCWFDGQAPNTITEIDVVRKLEECRAATGQLLDISFETIAGSGPHGALAHYRVTQSSNRTLGAGELLVLDGGGQYLDGTTDITRTLPIGDVNGDEIGCYTRVLKGMIAMSRVRWPTGLAGRDLDVIARYPLWLEDQDYNHGTGHGVGVHLCVHEGPQRLSRISEVPLDPGMIVSNEPGYYREGQFGIRIENLCVVQKADPLPGGDQTNKLSFETISFAPINKRLIDGTLLSNGERTWLNSYHVKCLERIGPLVSSPTRDWLEQATQPI